MPRRLPCSTAYFKSPWPLPTRRHQALDTATRAGESQAEACATSQASCSFYQEGEYWVITFRGKMARLKDVKGFQYIAHLLRHPGVELPAIDLAGSNSHSNARPW